ncbi:MAG: hypothetical protein IT383_26550 [Deltaproteobacteria bacterium]|nr:hypothetical protein [Deltaproteobacteria bacterium]
MLFRNALLLVTVTVTVASPALAQDDAGAPDAGNPCDPSCAGDVLSFCDVSQATTLDCAALGATCGALSAEWGPDCLLPAGASCEPGYAFGASRCDRAQSLYCIEGSCQVASGAPASPALTPSAGTGTASTTSATSDPFGCSSCGTASALSFLCFGGALRRLRRAVARAR